MKNTGVFARGQNARENCKLRRADKRVKLVSGMKGKYAGSIEVRIRGQSII